MSCNPPLGILQGQICAGVRDTVLDAVHMLYIKDHGPMEAARNLVSLAADANIGAMPALHLFHAARWLESVPVFNLRSLGAWVISSSPA